jgi:cysteine desulfurase
VHPIYLDNNATTRTDPEVVAAMLPYFTGHFGNPSSSHALGQTVAGAVRAARGQVQSLIGAAYDHEVIFTSGGTESDNAAIFSALETMPGRNEIVTTAVEHPAILAFVAHLARTRGVTVRFIGVDGEGRLDIAAFRAALGPKTAIASVMWANNETGVIFPVDMLASFAHEAGALFHTDAVQAVGKLPVDLKTMEIDLLSMSGHKFHGPKGIGALYIRKGVKFAPAIRGGRQERGRRAGTENVPAIVGLGKAAELAAGRLDRDLVRVRDLRDRFEAGMLQSVGACQALGADSDRLPNTADIAFLGVDNEAILHRLEKCGIAASSGSACASGTMEPSHVLRAMGVPAAALHGAIRFSLGRENTADEVGRVLDVLPGIISELRATSPLWQSRQIAVGSAPQWEGTRP